MMSPSRGKNGAGTSTVKARLRAIVHAGGARLRRAVSSLAWQLGSTESRPTLCQSRLVALLIGLLLPAAAVRAELQFEVSPGLDGLVPGASWFPITCEIFNDGPGFNGVIEIKSTYGRGLNLLVPVELPTNTRKRVSIPVFAPPAGMQTWDARLLDERGRARAEQLRLRPRQGISADSRLLAALPRTALGLPTLPEVPAGRAQLRPGVARLSPDSWPDNPLLLEGVAALYLNAERAAELKAPQINALLAWLHHGGHLIVGIEQAGDANATPWLRNLLPCTLGASGTLTPGDAFHNWLPNPTLMSQATTELLSTPLITNSAATNPAAKKKSKATTTTAGRLPVLAPDARLAGATLSYVTATSRGAEVLLAAEGKPLILQGRAQRGRVTVLAFNPEREPLLSWPHREWFWVRLADVPHELWTGTGRDQNRGRHLDAVFGTLVESRQVGKLPFLALLALLLGYLLVIGPGERYVLKRLRREMWTWITFPLIVAGFSLLIYFIGYKLRAGDTEWNELHVVDVARRGEGALLRGRTYGSVYSSGNQRYRFRAESGGPGALRGEAFAGGGGGFADDNSRIVRAGDELRADLRVPVWTSQLLAHDWHRTAPGAPLEFTVRATRDEWRVEIHNKLSQAVSQAKLIVGDRRYDLEAINSGEKKIITLAKNSNKSLRSFVQDRWLHIEPAVNARQSSFRTGDERSLDAFDTACAASFYSLADTPQDYRRFEKLPGFDLASAVEAGDAVLLAWVPGYAAQPPLNQFAALRSQRDTLFRLVTTPTPVTP
jgi:hypothetical protein